LSKFAHIADQARMRGSRYRSTSNEYDDYQRPLGTIEWYPNEGKVVMTGCDYDGAEYEKTWLGIDKIEIMDEDMVGAYSEFTRTVQTINFSRPVIAYRKGSEVEVYKT